MRDLGAQPVIDHRTQHFEDHLHGLDVQHDIQGGETLTRAFGVRRGGTLVTIFGLPTTPVARGWGLPTPAQWALALAHSETDRATGKTVLDLGAWRRGKSFVRFGPLGYGHHDRPAAAR